MPERRSHPIPITALRALLLSLCCTLVPQTSAATEPPLNVVCDLWPPYQMVVDGRLDGFSTQVVRRVFERLGVATRETRVYPWKRAIVMLERGAADALFSANYTAERARFSHYPDEPLVETPWVLWAEPSLAATYQGIDELRARRVGVVRGYSYTTEFWDFIKRHQVAEEAESDEQNFRKLQAGRLDFVVAEQGNGQQLVDRLGLSERVVPITAHPIKIDGLYLIFSKAHVSPELVARFSTELSRFKREAEYRRLEHDYLGRDMDD
ncbi:substrate-binding periplasmic protein [Marichromatium bheemlicum]|uniref:Amino acid ABC transporter substrate-binding protein n=1 Tax=Marichromatium bheemlicum TaxID=365339 RepID=A0ABX1I4J4_9GAMM|nr:transporter substrate-binding domain-containing protein [Marichromatium bheemlicum]NKN31904.1 amino acid ABC transporter substrate-binding protein [Marichromatium bheemlicum]